MAYLKSENDIKKSRKKWLVVIPVVILVSFLTISPFVLFPGLVIANIILGSLSQNNVAVNQLEPQVAAFLENIEGEWELACTYSHWGNGSNIERLSVNNGTITTEMFSHSPGDITYYEENGIGYISFKDSIVFIHGIYDLNNNKIGEYQTRKMIPIRMSMMEDDLLLIEYDQNGDGTGWVSSSAFRR